MKLIKLDLENFRQFYGEQSLEFSTDSHRNVTLVYGSNGAGKTTILNAFTWSLYGKTTPGLAESEWLISNLAWSEAANGETVRAQVRLEFEDKDHIYELVRTQKARKGKDGKKEIISEAEARLHVTDSGGQNEEVHNFEGAIGAILPQRLHRFAFFDGERDIERLVQPEATQTIEDAIKTVLGLEIFERGISHLNKARTTELNKELSDEGDDRDAALSTTIASHEKALEERKTELGDLRKNLTAQEHELSTVEDALSTVEVAKELQDRRKEIEAALQNAESRIRGADTGLDDKIRRAGFLAFTPKLLDAACAETRDLEDKGEIPAPLKRPFVQHLIDEAKCICGTDLPEGSPELEAVMAWFEKAGAPEVEARWNQVDTNAQNFHSKRDDLYRYLAETSKERTGYERERKVLEQKASEIEQSLTQVDDDAAKQLNAKRVKLRIDITDTQEAIGAKKLKISDLEGEKKKAEVELEEAKNESEKAAIARRRVSVAREVEDVFKKVLALRTRQTRDSLDFRIKQIFGDMCFRPYIPALTDDFQLKLSTRVGGDEMPVAKSTGESQILALSFIGAMADLARARYEESQEKKDGASLLNFQGGILPLVLDAVFGSLDDIYQEGVASCLPDLAPQVIVLVTRGSAISAIQQELWPRTGKTTVCAIYTSAEGEEEDSVDTPTGPVRYRVPINDSRDRSELFEV